MMIKTQFTPLDINKWERGANHGILSQKGMVPPPNAYTVSCLPWVSFKHFATHSYENKPYYFPSLEAGRLFTKTDDSEKPRLMMPLSITCHHAATDGWNCKPFSEAAAAGCKWVRSLCLNYNSMVTAISNLPFEEPFSMLGSGMKTGFPFSR